MSVLPSLVMEFLTGFFENAREYPRWRKSQAFLVGGQCRRIFYILGFAKASSSKVCPIQIAFLISGSKAVNYGSFCFIYLSSYPLRTGVKEMNALWTASKRLCTWSLGGLLLLALLATLGSSTIGFAQAAKPVAQNQEFDPVSAIEAWTDIFGEAFFASLFQDPVIVPGVQGTLRISGDVWTFNGFSSDGMLFIDGELIVEKDKFPELPIRGNMVFSGVEEGTLILDLLIAMQGEDVVFTGTVQVDDQVWDINELMDSSRPTAVETVTWGALKRIVR